MNGEWSIDISGGAGGSTASEDRSRDVGPENEDGAAEPPGPGNGEDDQERPDEKTPPDGQAET